MSRGRPAPLVKFQHIIQLFTVLLTAILISLFFAALVLVGKIQGTARVVNYAGLVRGKTQRIVKLEISGTPEDDLLGDVASYIEGLRFGSSELDLVRLDNADFQTKMTALSSEFDDLRNELILVRQRGYTETAIIAKSEHFFQTCDEATNLAEVYSQKRATALDFLEKVVLADIVGLLLLFGYQIFKALRYAAMNRILQRKVYLDEATGLPNKNKCEELLDAPDPPDGNTALCVFDLNNLRTINNNLWTKTVQIARRPRPGNCRTSSFCSGSTPMGISSRTASTATPCWTSTASCAPQRAFSLLTTAAIRVQWSRSWTSTPPPPPARRCGKRCS